MKVKASFVHLHAPLFFAGRNWGEKLDIKNTSKGKFELIYDRDAKELEITCEGKTTCLPSTSVFSYEPYAVLELKQVKEAIIQPEPAIPGKPPRKSAQASTPMDHVYKGLGAGKTND